MSGEDPTQVPGGVNYGQHPTKNPITAFPGHREYGQPRIGGAPAGWASEGAMPILKQPSAGGMNPNAYLSKQPAAGQAGAGAARNARGLAPYADGEGLKYLSQVDMLFVKQQVELLEAFTGIETCNRYTVYNNLGQKVYFATESSDNCMRMCCGPLRPLRLWIAEKSRRGDILDFSRPLRCYTSCCSWCCFCCLQEMVVHDRSGALLGSVVQEWSILYPNFSIKDAAGVTQLTVEGPFCPCSLGDAEFQVYSAVTREEVGNICKKWPGFVEETYTDADNFLLNFPIDMHVNLKAVLLAAVFLIDYMFFETTKSRNKNAPSVWSRNRWS